MNRIYSWMSKHPTATLVGLMFVVFSIGMIGVDIVRINIRFALMTAEMANGKPGLFPTMNGHPYADYPSLYNFLSYLTSGGARWLNLWTLSLPSILLSCCIVAMTAKVGDLIRPGCGFCAALFSLFSYEYLNIFKGFSIDLPVAAAVLAIVWSLLRFDFSCRALLVYVPMLFISFAVRGSLGIVICGAATAGVILGARRWKALLLYGAVGAATAAGCLGIACWAIHRQGGNELWRWVLEWQISSRMNEEKKLLDYVYYFTDAQGSFMPVTGFAVAALIMKRRELTKPYLAIPVMWALVPMVMLSIPTCMHLRYMTAMLPAFAIVAAIGYRETDASPVGKLIDWAFEIIDKLILPAGAALIVTAAVMSFFLPVNREQLFAHLAAAAAMTALVCLMTNKCRNKPWQLIRAALAMMIMVGIVVTAADAMWENSAIFVRRVAKISHGRIFLYMLDPDHDALKVVYHLDPEERAKVTMLYRAAPKGKQSELLTRMYPYFAPEEKLASLTPEDVLIAHEKRLRALYTDAAKADRKVVILARGRLGHRKSVVVKLLPADASPQVDAR